MGMTKHTTPNNGRCDWHQFVNHIRTASGRTSHSTQGHTGVALGIRVNQQSLWEAGCVVSNQRVGRGPLVPTRECSNCLIWIVLWAAGNWNPVLRNKQELHLVLLTRRGIRLWNLFMGALWLSRLRSSKFHQMSKEHIRVNLHWMPYTWREEGRKNG